MGIEGELLPEDTAEELYEGAPCGYLSALPDGTILRINQTLLSWLGETNDTVVRKKRFADLVTIGGRLFLETHVVPLLQMQGSVQEIALDLVRAGQPPLPVLMSAVLKRDAAGKPRVTRATLFDATDRRKYERELVHARKQAEAAAKAKADFVSLISHELRTPMSAIIGVAHLLKQTELSPHQEKLTNVLRSSADNLLNLINDILDFSKIEAGKVTLEQRPVDLRALVDELVATFGIKAEEKGVTLVKVLDDALPPAVLGDPVKVRQILVNLVGNAIKFTPKGDVVITITADAPGAIGFEVRDTGIGIARERLAQIFDDFTQASYDISIKYGGTGLGLAITRRLIELHGSKIHVESALGQGTRFWFTLAMRDATAAEPPSKAADDRLDVVRGLRVLLADDNEVNQFVIATFLEKWGVQCDVVPNGRQAVERIATHSYDVVLMDLQMPELNGYDAARAIRRMKDARFQRVPIIAVSASMRMGDQQNLAETGFTDFIGKPVAPEVLLEKLAEYARHQLE